MKKTIPKPKGKRSLRHKIFIFSDKKTQRSEGGETCPDYEVGKGCH